MSQQYVQQQPAFQQAAPVQQQPAPVVAGGTASSGPAVPNIIIASPPWVLVIRIAQIVISIIILGLSAYLMHGAYADAQGLATATTILTWVIVAYTLLTEKVVSLNSLYHIAAVLSLDAFLIVMWLSAMAVNAHHRSRFKYVADISGCYDDGSAFDSTVCWRKRSLDRDYVASQAGLAIMIVLSLLCAVELILFAVVFGRTLKTYLDQRNAAAGVAVAAAPTDAEKQGAVQLQQQPVYAAQTIQPQYTGQPMQPQQYAPAPIPSPSPQPVQPVYAAQPIQPQYTGQPIQPQYTGPQQQQQQFMAAATPPPGQPIHEAPAHQPMAPQYTGGTVFTPSTQTSAPTYQELPAQYDQKHPGSPSPPPAQNAYGHQ